jgi:pSer/pThr/pTyr-binding forkhead associated (FHA) protein
VIPAPPARLVLGRAETCDLVIEDADASREHIDLVIDLDGVIARDRGSKNGLIVNERALAEKRLVDRDELLVGATVVVFEDLESIAMRETERSPDEPITEPPAQDVGAHSPGSDGSATAPADDPEAPTGDPDADHALGHDPATSPSEAGAPRAGSAPSPVAPRRAAISAVELLIYALAAIVLAASIAGLVLLLRSE